MTHITQEQANELAAKHGLWSFRESPASLLVICNAAIQTYLDSLSAELPEPAIPPTGVVDNEGRYTRDQMLQALAARDAHHRSLRNAYEQQTLTLAQQDDEERAELKAQADRLADANDKLFLQLQTMQAERDAALQDAKRWAKMRDLFTTLGVDYYYLEGRSAEEITEWVDGKGKV